MISPKFSTIIRLGHVHDDLHIMFDEQNRDSFSVNLANEIDDFIFLRRVEPTHRLIEEEKFGLDRQRPGNLQLLLIAVGQVFGYIVSA